MNQTKKKYCISKFSCYPKTSPMWTSIPGQQCSATWVISVCFKGTSLSAVLLTSLNCLLCPNCKLVAEQCGQYSDEESLERTMTKSIRDSLLILGGRQIKRHGGRKLLQFACLPSFSLASSSMLWLRHPFVGISYLYLSLHNSNANWRLAGL